MNLNDFRAIKASARQSLAQQGKTPGKLVMYYGGATAGVFLLSFLVNILLMQQIEQTGGLAGMGVRSVLSSIQVLLQYGTVFFMLYWQMGFLYTCLQFAKGENPKPKALLEGFRNPGSVFGVAVMLTLIMIGITVLVSYLGAFLFTLFPMPSRLYEVMETVMAQSGSELALDSATVTEMMQMLRPVLLIIAGLFLLMGVPVFYRFRMARLCLMEEPRVRTFGAIQFSAFAMRKNRMKLFKLDLSFWWYYVLQVLVLGVSMGDVWLAKLGVQFSPMLGYVVFYLLYLVLQFGLTVWAGAYVQTSYAEFYLTLKEEKLREATQIITQTEPWNNSQA